MSTPLQQAIASATGSTTTNYHISDGGSVEIQLGTRNIHVGDTVNYNNYYNAPSTLPTNRVFYRPNPSALFQGREAELQRLKDYFRPRVNGEPLSRRSLLLHGMGGIGKTQICLKFAEEAAHQ